MRNDSFDLFGICRKLIVAAALAAAPLPALAQASLIGVAQIPASVPGGLSGVELTGGGSHMIAIADSGLLVRMGIARDSAGAISGFGRPQITRLGRPQGAGWPEGGIYSDAEGLALLPNGQLAVSYEGLHRVSLHSANGGFATMLDQPELFQSFELNEGIEGLARASDGALIMVSEGVQRGSGAIPLYRYAGGQWSLYAQVPRRGRHVAVGLDFDNRGRLYLLERDFRGLGGISTRLRRLTIRGGAVASEEILLQTPHGQHGNLEGVSIWTRGGALIATLIADNNESAFFSHEIVEYRLPN